MVDNQNREIHIDEEDASGGSKEGVVRWILGIGLLLAIVFLSLIWIIPALTQGDAEEEATVSGEIQSMEDDGNSTDSIIGTEGTATDLGDDTVSAPEDQTTTEDGLEVVEN